MIEFLRGNLLSRDADNHIVVDVGGVGYGLDVPASTAEALPAKGQEVELRVSFIMREDAIRLYGFLTEAEQTVFEIFQKISGIGPRTALDVLSSVTIRELVGAIRLGNVSVLTRIPGIGRKKAERLIVELKDQLKRFPVEAGSEIATGYVSPDDGLEVGAAGSGGLYEDAVAALEALGLKPNIAARNVALALRTVDADTATVEEIVKTALQVR